MDIIDKRAKKKSKICMIGGPDVNTRIPLIQCLNNFQIIAVGSLRDLRKRVCPDRL